jgi:2-polyprenyl-3-methyl-5-hydroxy-6-metoxy-1,4-benzoquinol methylase
VVARLLLEETDCHAVLDIPCGAGAFTRRMLSQGREVAAADCENILLLSDQEFHQVDMNERLPFADGAFDAVVCIDGIEHIERPFDFISECHRVLRAGGVFIISTPNLMALRSRWRWLLTGFHQGEKSPLAEQHPNPLHHVSLVSFADLRYRLHTKGFRITAVETNRVKFISWAYAIFLPLAYVMTRWVFQKEEKDPQVRAQNREIFKQIFSVPVLFGETLIVKAVREPD